MTPDTQNLPGMIGRHPAMLEVYRLTRLAARSELPVVIVGETGTGKELVARAVHQLSACARGPFMDINCGAVPETLAEAELFGAERGAFTGAVRTTPGMLELADGGTLFLDEACSLPTSVQVKLLRALERGEVRRVGGRRQRRSRFRLVCAVARPLGELVATGSFREDFAYRVGGLTITLPPLRTRSSDVRLLAEHFLAGGSPNGRPPRRLAADAVRLLCGYPWPGNVREVKAFMERLAVVTEDVVIGAAAVLAQLPDGGAHGAHDGERLRALLEAHGWNVSRAARTVGLHRSTLHERIKALDLVRPQ